MKEPLCVVVHFPPLQILTAANWRIAAGGQGSVGMGLYYDGGIWHKVSEPSQAQCQSQHLVAKNITNVPGFVLRCG